MPGRRLPPKFTKMCKARRLPSVCISGLSCDFYFPHTFSAVPHTGHLPTHHSGSPIPHTSFKNPAPIPTRPATGAANPAPIRFPHLPSTCVSGLHTSPTRKSTLAPARPWRASKTRRDQRPACANLRARPAYSNSLRRRGGHGHGVASRCGDGDDRGAGMSWSGLWPGSPGNRGRPDPAKTYRRGAGSRRTDGRSRRPPARPGVTSAPRRWGTVSLPF